MTIDISRKTFDPARNTAWTTTMQGRVATDAPVNEDRQVRDRRLRATMVDLVGRSGHPAILPDSFRVEVSGGALVVHPGRYYVDGHPAENFGTGSPVFDDVLSEMRGPDPVPADDQPYLPGAVPLAPEDGTHLVYLDVWQRDVTFLQDLTILDPAIATDTFARRQTVWQVRTLGPVGPGIDCASDDQDIPDWPDEIRPSDARLTTRANPASAEFDPCLLPPGAEYRATENRTYRVEVHEIAGGGTPMLKVSRVNGVVATTVLSQPQGDVLEVAQVAKDDFLRFSDGDWVEITDEARLLAGTPGVMARILTVDQPSDTITFDAPLPVDALRLVGGGPEADQEFRPVVRRWDQANQVLDENGTVLVDLDLIGADGLIPAPTDGTFIALEDGVEVALTLADPAGTARVGDSWTFIARYADSSVEELSAAPPQDFQHHYARLAMVAAVGGAFTEVLEDCRDPFVEEACCCTVVVNPGESIQAAIDSLPPDVGGCVCLKPGEHVIGAPLTIATPNVTLHGESHGAAVRLDGFGPVLRITGTAGVEVHTLAFRHTASESGLSGLIEIESSSEVAVSGCAFSAERGSASVGIAVADATDIRIRDCRFTALTIGVAMTVRCDHVQVAGNIFDLDSEDFDGLFGIVATQAVGAIVATGNRVSGVGTGICINDDASGQQRGSLAAGSLIADNDIELLFSRLDPEDEIALHGIDAGCDDTVIRGNRIRLAGSGRAGIRATGAGVKIVENVVEGDPVVDDDARNVGILVGVPGDAVHRTEGVAVCSNTVRGTSTCVFARDAAEVVVSGNDLRSFSPAFQPAVSLSETSSAMVSSNTVLDAGSGIIAQNGRHTVIEGNRVARSGFAIGLLGEYAPSVRGNSISEAGLFGVLALQCLARVSIVENHLSNAGSVGELPFGIGALFILGEWHVEANEVLDTGLPLDGEMNQANVVGIFGILVLEARVESNLVSYASIANVPDPRDDRALVMQGILEVIVFTGDRPVSFGFPCQITNNKFIGRGARALVELRQTQIADNILLRFERVFFNHNYCNHLGGIEGAGNATVILDGTACVVMGNQIKAESRDPPSMNLGNMAGTVVGNVTTAGIVNDPNFPNPEGSFNFIQ